MCWCSSAQVPEIYQLPGWTPLLCRFGTTKRVFWKINSMGMSYMFAIWQSCNWDMSHVNHGNESWHTHVVPTFLFFQKGQVSQVFHVKGFTCGICHTCEWVMAHICMGPLTHVNTSWYTSGWVMSQTNANESCHTHECGVCDMIYSCDMTHSRV